MVESNDLWTVVLTFAVSVILMMVALALTWAFMRFPFKYNREETKNKVFYVTYNGISFIVAAENRKKAAKFLNDYLKAKGFAFTVSDYYLQNFVMEAGDNVVSLGYANPESEED